MNDYNENPGGLFEYAGKLRDGAFKKLENAIDFLFILSKNYAEEFGKELDKYVDLLSPV